MLLKNRQFAKQLHYWCIGCFVFAHLMADGGIAATFCRAIAHRQRTSYLATG